ncbi:MAG: tetratricopeptide repeat protein [Candidatus Peregrinibacteria bacterium]|nr:tetratricopeptide repeat protein [Candidatus Peregrinibacteria bacterium]
MWTYLLLFLSISLFVGVFARRAYILKVKKNEPPVQKKSLIDDEPLDIDENKKLSKQEKIDISDLCEKADVKLKVGEEDEAIRLLVQALAVDPANTTAQQKLAMLYMQKQMYSAAAALFKQLGELTNDAVHYSNLGLALYQQQEFEAAKEAYQRAVALDPSRPQRFISLAQVYRSLDQLSNAVVAANKAHDMDPENMDFLFLLADLHMDSKNYDESVSVLTKIIEADPGNTEAKTYLKKVKKAKSEEEKV